MNKKKSKYVSKKSGKSSKIKENLKLISVLVLIFILILSYHIFLKSNINLQTERYYLFIPSKFNSEELGNFLKEKGILQNSLSYSVMSGWMDSKISTKRGLYEIEKGWNNYQLINYFQNAKPIPSKEFSVPVMRDRNLLIKKIANDLNLDKDKLKKLLDESMTLEELKEFNKESIYCIFIPGNYWIPTFANEKDVIKILYGEYLRFWNNERSDKADDLDLTPAEVTILASIVYSETKATSEMSVIAGVYLNRLEENIKLESDPTLVYAGGNFSVRRVYKGKKLLYPDYNTYEKKGLPPGPIYIVPPFVIDEVLNSQDHDYYFFCAKDDTSGCHLFATTYNEHKINAQKYRRYLNSKGIY